MNNINPSNGKVYGQIPDSDESDIDKAVKSAQKVDVQSKILINYHKAFPKWSKTPRQERSKILNKIADLIESRLEEFAEAESKDQGKPVSLARTVDIPRVIHNFRYFAGTNYPRINPY